MNTVVRDTTISTWNCERTIKPKLKMEAFSRLKSDIAVLQEVRQADLIDFPGATSYRWIGPTDGAGVAVIGFDGWTIEQPLICAEEWFLPTIATRGPDRVTILAVWVKPDGGNYIAPTVRALNSLKDFLSGASTIIAGDFNANAAWDGTASASKYGFRRQLGLLTEMGFSSLWHHQSGEGHGSESQATRYQGRKEALPYHVDYAFVSNDLLPSVSPLMLGSFREWTQAGHSDHVPLSFGLRPAHTPP